jgi:hypothetical protein
MAFDRKANRRRYYLENREKEVALALARYKKNREASMVKHKEWLKENTEQIRTARRNRYKNDQIYKLQSILRSRFFKAIKRGTKNESSIELVGCTIEELKVYIESQFKEGMTWQNWNYRGWHIDHITPIAMFDLRDEQQKKQAFHFTNLQPMWGIENIKKGARLYVKS